MEILANNSAHDGVQTFNFNGLPLRALLVDGEPWFIRADACTALGINNPAQAVANFDAEDKGVITTDTPGGRQQVATISEAGLYQLIFQSRKAEAKAFKRWVTHDVLPAIRKTGSYEAPKTDAEKVLEVIQLLQAQAEEQRQELEQARPKVEVYDRVLTPEHTFGFRDLCKTIRDRLPVTEADVKRVLREKKIIMPGFRLDVYSAAIDAGWAVRRPAGKWGGKERFQPRFTTKTLEWLLDELAPLEEVA